MSFDSLEAMSRAAAEAVRALAIDAIERRKRFTLALAGGTTPRLAYVKMARDPALEWDFIHLFFGDERCVPPTHDYSNYRMVRESLLDPARISPRNVHRMPGELGARQGAAVYEREVARFFGPSNDPPRFDCVLLGMGVDGHTASLFPDSETLADTQNWVAPVLSPAASPPVDRITLTLPVLNAAHAVLFMVAGKSKEAVLQKVLTAKPDASPFPAARVAPRKAPVWFISP